MVKKSIIALALIGMLATASFGIDLPGGTQYKGSGYIKIDGLWPGKITFEYTKIEICRIPVKIKVGMFIEIDQCNKKQILLEQVNCTSGRAFPCYADCESLRARANFPAQLSLKLYKVQPTPPDPDIIDGDKYDLYFTATDGTGKATTWNIDDTGNWNEFKICLEIWDANIYGLPYNTTQNAGEIAILVMPLVTPDFCDYCP